MNNSENIKTLLNKSLAEIRKYSETEYDANLFLLFIINLIKDELLKPYRNQLVHLGTPDFRNIFQKLSFKKRTIYEKILMNYKTRVFQKYALVLDHIIKYFNGHNFDNETFSNAFEVTLNSMFQHQLYKRDTLVIKKEITDLIYGIEKRENISVYNPFSGMGDFSLGKNIVKYYGQESSGDAFFFHCLRILVHDMEEYAIIDNVNPIEKFESTSQKYDLIVSCPPISKIDGLQNRTGNSERIETYEQFFFINAINNLEKNGKIIALIPQGFLYFDGICKEIRKEWISNDYLDLIIQLPEKSAVINSGMQYYLVVLNLDKKIKNIVRFIDARKFNKSNGYNLKSLITDEVISLINNQSENEYVRLISNQTIEENNYTLTVDKYFVKSYKGTPLSELSTVITGRKTSVDEIGKFVQIQNLNNDKVNYFITSDEIESVNIKYGYGKEIKEDCLLLAIKGLKLKPTYFKYSGDSIFISPNIIALKIKEELIDIGYLIKELGSDYVKEQLYAFHVTQGVPSVTRKNLLSIKIDTGYGLEYQRKISEKVAFSAESERIKENELQKQNEKKFNDLFDQVRIKKHTIMQFMNNIILSIDILKSEMDKSNGILESKKVINKKTGTTIKMQFDKLDQSSKSAIYYIDKLSEGLTFDKKEPVDLNLLIIDSKNQGREDDDLFEIEYIFYNESFKIHISEDTKDVYIDPIAYISKADFHIVYNNIIENAIRHGFSKREKKYKFKIELKSSYNNDFTESATIIFSNNGKPFPEGMAEAYCIKGEKAGPESNDGIGSWKVCEIIRNHFGGDIKIFDNPQDEFPVRIEITLPLIGIE
jgi:type I restriction enzyme M protein